MGREGGKDKQLNTGKTPYETFKDDRVSKESCFTGIVPVEMLGYFNGAVILQDIHIRAGHTGGEITIKGGEVLTTPLINKLEKSGVMFVSVTSSEYYNYLKETGELDKIHGIPVRNEKLGYDIEKMREDFYAISAEAVSSRGLAPDRVDHIMKQLVGISESILTFGKVLSSMRSISNFSEYTYKHSLEVMIISLLLAKQLEKDKKIRPMTQRQTLSLAIGAFFHDIGKTMVPWEILEKPGRLVGEEKKHMDAHVTAGWLIVNNMVIPSLRKNFASIIDEKMILDIVGGHHWRYDNMETGNRAGYKAEKVDKKDIHPWAFIVGIADAVDAMGTERTYQARRHNTQIKEVLELEKGKQFSPEFVPAMMQILVDYPENSITVFKDGSYGVVKKHDNENSFIEVDMYGTLVEEGEKRFSEGTVKIPFEKIKREIALGSCYFDRIDKDVAEYIKKHPKEELSLNLLVDYPDRKNLGKLLQEERESRDKPLFTVAIAAYIQNALGGQEEIQRIVKQRKAVDEQRVEFSFEQIRSLADMACGVYMDEPTLSR